MRLRGRWAWAALVLVGAVVLVGVLFPVPYVTLSPGPVFDVLAENDQGPVLDVTGAPTYPAPGRLDLTTVSELGGTSGSTSLAAAVVGWLSPDRSVEPRSQRFPEGTDTQQQRAISRAVFDASASTALAAAADHLGRPVFTEVLVSQVEPGSPADGNLESGDVLVRVAGQQVESSQDVGRVVRSQQAGADIAVDYLRDGEPGSVTITSTSLPGGGQGAYLGVLLIDSYSSDFEVDLSLSGIGGPSAGLVFAVGIVDKMTPEEVVAGEHMAATGTIGPDGAVGPIGGVDKKLVGAADAGATLFLAPRDNCDEVGDRIPEGLDVVPVSTLDEALAAAEAWRSGESDLPRCK